MWLKEKCTVTIFLLLIPVLLVTGSSIFSLLPVSEASAAAPTTVLEANMEIDPSLVLLASPTTRPMLDLTMSEATVMLPVEQSSSAGSEYELLGDPEEYFQKSG